MLQVLQLRFEIIARLQRATANHCEMLRKALWQYVVTGGMFEAFAPTEAAHNKLKTKLMGQFRWWLADRPLSQTTASKLHQWMQLWDEASDRVLQDGAALLMAEDGTPFNTNGFFQLMQIKMLKNTMPRQFNIAIHAAERGEL